MSTIKSDIKRTEEHLAELSDPAYVDRVIDEFADASQAGKELRDEKIRMDKKLLDLKYAERKTVEAIDDLNKKLSS